MSDTIAWAKIPYWVYYHIPRGPLPSQRIDDRPVTARWRVSANLRSVRPAWQMAQGSEVRLESSSLGPARRGGVAGGRQTPPEPRPMGLGGRRGVVGAAFTF